MYKKNNFECLSYNELLDTNGGNPAVVVVVKTTAEIIGYIASANAIYNFVEGVRDGYNEAEQQDSKHGGGGRSF